MICENCKHIADDGDKFCRHCGKEFTCEECDNVGEDNCDDTEQACIPKKRISQKKLRRAGIALCILLWCLNIWILLAIMQSYSSYGDMVRTIIGAVSLRELWVPYYVGIFCFGIPAIILAAIDYAAEKKAGRAGFTSVTVLVFTSFGMAFGIGYFSELILGVGIIASMAVLCVCGRKV